MVCSAKSISTISTCVDSLPDCLWETVTRGTSKPVTGVVSGTTTTIWETEWVIVCIPPIPPKSGGCSWFHYNRPPHRTETAWSETSTCIYPDAAPSCIYTYSGKCVGLEEASTKGQPSPEPPGPTTTVVVTASETRASKTLSPPPDGKGEGGCTWGFDKEHKDRRECWIGNNEVDE